MHPTEERPARQAGQQWDAAQYASNGRFVADLASEVLTLLDAAPGERVLDLGCGDGALADVLRGGDVEVVACDKDPSMLAAAAARGLRTVQADMTDLPFSREFDAVFSNAALHWTRNQAAVLDGVRRSLVPGGRFVAEMGGLGNIAAVRTALKAAAAPFGIDAEETAASFYPSVRAYRELLESCGFKVETITLHPRPTFLACGMAEWLRTFRKAVLQKLSPGDQDSLIARTVELLSPALQDADGTWWADYVRLRFRARLPA